MKNRITQEIIDSLIKNARVRTSKATDKKERSALITSYVNDCLGTDFNSETLENFGHGRRNQKNQ